MIACPRPGRAPRRGFTLIEVTFSLVVFLMMTMVFAALVPVALRGAKMSDNYAQAAQIAQHKIDQLRTAGFSSLNYTALSGQGLIDAAPNTSPFSFAGVDNLVNTGANGGLLPPGSTGTLTIQDYNAFQTAHGITANLPPPGTVAWVTVTVTWTGGGITDGRYSASALIVQMKHT